jgi:hypothetical protein
MSISLTVLSGEAGGEITKQNVFWMTIFLTVLSEEAGGGNYNPQEHE